MYAYKSFSPSSSETIEEKKTNKQLHYPHPRCPPNLIKPYAHHPTSLPSLFIGGGDNNDNMVCPSPAHRPHKHTHTHTHIYMRSCLCQCPVNTMLAGNQNKRINKQKNTTIIQGLPFSPKSVTSKKKHNIFPSYK